MATYKGRETALTKPIKAKLTLESYIALGVTAVEERLKSELEPLLTDKRTAAELAHTYSQLRIILDEWERVEEMLKSWKEKMSKETVPAAFEREKITSFTTQSGYRVTISPTLYASIKAGLKDKAFAWLRKNRLGDLIIETVNSSTLSAATKARIENEGKDMPESIFNVVTGHNTSFTKVKS